MARARNIKPGFFTNDILAECDPLARILFAGLWTIADRAGRLEDRPKKIKAEILPYDNCNVDKLLNELNDRSFIFRYEVGTLRYIQILAFEKHQNPHVKEAKSIIPEPVKSCASPVQDTPQTGTSPADSLNLIPDSLIPQSKPCGANKKRKRSLMTTIPDDFSISDRMRSWADANYVYNLSQHFEFFVNAAKAKGYEYADWDRALMNAVLADWAKIGRGSKDEML